MQYQRRISAIIWEKKTLNTPFCSHIPGKQQASRLRTEADGRRQLPSSKEMHGEEGKTMLVSRQTGFVLENIAIFFIEMCYLHCHVIFIVVFKESLNIR